MLYANISALESRLNELKCARMHADATFYMEVAHSFASSLKEFDSQRCNDGGLTTNASWMIGIITHLEYVLNTKNVQEFLDAFDNLNYEDQVQLDSKEWYNLGCEVVRLGLEIVEVKKQLAIANQNCQLKQALKDAGF